MHKILDKLIAEGLTKLSDEALEELRRTCEHEKLSDVLVRLIAAELKRRRARR